MLFGLLLRSTKQPIQLHLVLSFAEPLRLSGKVDPLQIESSRSFDVKVTEQAPIALSVSNRAPVKVEVSNPNPVQIKVDQAKPMVLDVDPQEPVKVKVGL
jgi:hypothetical protein